ncbi:MAG: ribosome small subunit-dependent GTPase A [Acidobacteriota bacterium]
MQESVLAQFGWNEHLANLFETAAQQGLEPGRVVFEDNIGYRVQTARLEIYSTVSGRLRHEASGREDLPAVGDWVSVRVSSDDARAVIHSVLPRRSCFTRKVTGARTAQQIVGANIDTIFLVTSLNQDFNLRRIERYLSMAWEGGAQPVVVLSKADLCPDVQILTEAVREVARAVPVHPVSVVSGDGLDSLAGYIRFGETVALLGSSGVGKSTLINFFVGYHRQQVKEVREHDDRGKHATRRRELILLPQGGLLLDTPGMRELQLWEGGEGVQATFDDIEALALNCFFGDCQHESEPRCAVRNARAEGQLDSERLESYLKLQRELRKFKLKHDEVARKLEKQQSKKLGHFVKERAREKRGGR